MLLRRLRSAAAAAAALPSELWIWVEFSFSRSSDAWVMHRAADSSPLAVSHRSLSGMIFFLPAFISAPVASRGRSDVSRPRRVT